MTVHWHGPTLPHVVHHRALGSLEGLETEWRHTTEGALVMLHVLHAGWGLHLLIQRRAYLMWRVRSLWRTLWHERPRAIRRLLL